MLIVILLPLLALAGGVGGFLLRRWELTAAFEESGLAIPWAFPTVALVVLSVLLAAAFALLCRGSKNELKSYEEAFSAPGNWGYLVVTAIASACLLIAGMFGFIRELRSGAPSPLRVLLWALCLVSFCCILATILGNFRASSRQRSIFLLLPAYTCCLWLVSAYQQRAADPVVLDYMYELFAIICTLLGFYFTAGFSFERAKPWRCAFFCLLSVYFGMVTLADSHTQSTCLLFLFSILYQLATVTVLLYNAFAIKPKRLAGKESQTPAPPTGLTPPDESPELCQDEPFLDEQTQEVTPDE